MALVNYKEIFSYAKEHRLTIGAFNTVNVRPCRQWLRRQIR